LEQAQQKLNPGEAIVSIYTSENYTYVWAVPYKGKINFVTIPLSKRDLQKTIAQLRKAINPDPETFVAGMDQGDERKLTIDEVSKYQR